MPITKLPISTALFCRCQEQWCGHDGWCQNLGIITLHRTDRNDSLGTLMCRGCRDRALKTAFYRASRLDARPNVERSK